MVSFFCCHKQVSKWQNWFFTNFERQLLKITQLLPLVIFVSVSLVRENQRGLRENLKRKIQPKTKKMQQITHDCIAFSPSAFGELVVVVLKMLTYRKKELS